MDSDIAVIEEYDANRYTWDIIAYIGKDRTGGVLDATGGTLRIRYLENKGIVDLKHAKGNFRTIVGKGEIPSYWREIEESIEKDEYNFFGVKIKVTKCTVTLGISNELDLEFTIIDKVENLDNFSLWEKELNKHGSLMIEGDYL